jgi:hypothetical protein
MLVEMAVKLMETAMEAMESIEMALGALPHPDRVPEQRLLPPKIRRRWRRSCGTSFGKLPFFRVFSQEALNRRRGDARGGPGGPCHTLAWPREGRHGMVWPAPGPPSGSLSVFVMCPRKIGGSGFVSSNWESISYVAFLKHKNNRKRGTGTMASRQ